MMLKMALDFKVLKASRAFTKQITYALESFYSSCFTGRCYTQKFMQSPHISNTNYYLTGRTMNDCLMNQMLVFPTFKETFPEGIDEIFPLLI